MVIKKFITYFKKPGKENTQKVIDSVKEEAKSSGIKKIVVASSSGDTALKFINAFKESTVKVIPVVLNAGSKWSGNDEWKVNRKKFIDKNIPFVQSIQAFSGVERAINARWGTAGPVMLISDALRIFGEGTKVAIEVTLMAADAGDISPDEDIIAVAGTSRGADTALIVKPAYSTKFFELAVKEIICKPLIEGVKHAAR